MKTLQCRPLHNRWRQRSVFPIFSVFRQWIAETSFCATRVQIEALEGSFISKCYHRILDYLLNYVNKLVMTKNVML